MSPWLPGDINVCVSFLERLLQLGEASQRGLHDGVDPAANLIVQVGTPTDGRLNRLLDDTGNLVNTEEFLIVVFIHRHLKLFFIPISLLLTWRKQND